MSPHDHLILDRWVRYVGDAVAIVAGETEAAVDRAMKLIKVKYDVKEPVLDFRTAKDNPNLVHPEDNWHALIECGGDPKRNLIYHEITSDGDVDQVLAECDYVVEQTYHTQANQQAMMETFRAFCYMDAYGRLNCVAATQITFHVRRILSHALQIPKNKVRVIKPRIGGGFGAKQTAVVEVYPAFVTWMTGKPSMIIYSRYESQIASSPRHEMEMKVRVGANKDGIIQAIDLHTLSNSGAFGEHGPTTVGLSGHKSIPLYGKAKAFRFEAEVVYTNVMDAGAYRGYGATQGGYGSGEAT
jgi:CO/xanthine dehydrogenase Mo-binding subunit